MTEHYRPAWLILKASMIKRKLAYRLYLATIRFEGMVWLKLRRKLLNLPGVNIFAYAFVEGAPKVGRSVSFNRNCFIDATGGLTIGSHVGVGHAATILSSEHGEGGIIQFQPMILRPTIIGDNCRIGARAIILAGVSLPEGTIVAAGSVVTKSFSESYCTIAGNPAKIIARRQAIQTTA